MFNFVICIGITSKYILFNALFAFINCHALRFVSVTQKIFKMPHSKYLRNLCSGNLSVLLRHPD